MLPPRQNKNIYSKIRTLTENKIIKMKNRRIVRSTLTHPRRNYAITLSCNQATHKHAYDQYVYVIKNFPTGTFDYVKERSKNGKYHIHGLMKFDYNFNYLELMDSRRTEHDNQFDIHIWYKQLLTDDDYRNYQNYCSKYSNDWITQKTDPGQIRDGTIPSGPIPEIQICQYYKNTLQIPGLYEALSHVTEDSLTTDYDATHQWKKIRKSETSSP